MPTYTYRCKMCGVEFDVHQSMKDEPLTVCENCGGKLQKIINSVGIVFKGSGFYHNDSKSKANSAMQPHEHSHGAEKADTTSSDTNTDSGPSNDAAKPSDSGASVATTESPAPSDSHK